MPVKAVVFDLDGTLVDFKLDYMAVRAEVKQFLVKCGFPPSIFSINESIFEMLKKIEVFMRNNGEDRRKIDEVKAKVLSIADKYELEAARQTRLVPGAVEALNELKKVKLKLGLFTINGSKATSHVLRSFRLKRFFDAVVTRENALKVKPDVSHLEAVLNALKVKPKETVVVGDSVIDVKSARALGAFAVGVPTGISTVEELTRVGAMCVITSLTDVPRLVSELNEKEKQT